jgi:hypothetical protein
MKEWTSVFASINSNTSKHDRPFWSTGTLFMTSHWTPRHAVIMIRYAPFFPQHVWRLLEALGINFVKDMLLLLLCIDYGRDLSECWKVERESA